MDRAAARQAGAGALTEVRPVAGAEDLDAWVEAHNRVAPVPHTVAEVAAYRDALAGDVLDMGGPNDRPEAVFVAVAGGEVVGYSKLHLSDAGRAWPRTTGRASGARGAGALKGAQLAWAKASGSERLEAANETGTRRSSG